MTVPTSFDEHFHVLRDPRVGRRLSHACSHPNPLRCDYPGSAFRSWRKISAHIAAVDRRILKGLNGSGLFELKAIDSRR
jgi:hypothetical protein